MNSSREARTALVEHLDYLIEKQKVSKTPDIFVDEIKFTKKKLERMYKEATFIIGHIHRDTLAPFA